MKSKIKAFVLFLILADLGLVFPKDVLASSFQLSGKVIDSSGVAISGAVIDVIDISTNHVVASTTSNSLGSYDVPMDGGIYDVQVISPSNSNFSPAIARNRRISSDTVINFILVNAGTANLSGYLRDALGHPLPNQTISFDGVSTITDTAGFYSLTAVVSTARLEIVSNHNDPLLNVPQYYDVTVSNYPLTQSTVLDITLPFKQVQVHVQDSLLAPIGNTHVTALNPIGPGTPANFNSLSIGGGITNASGASEYGTLGNTAPETDSSGNLTLWLFPNNGSQKYSFTANPPSGSSYQSLVLANVVVSNDVDLTITLQRPVTLTGHVFDPLGNPVTNQVVSLSAGGVSGSGTTDASGNYSIEISPGIFRLEIGGQNNISSLNIPQWYNLTVNNFYLTSDRILDITIPAKKVILRTQDAFLNRVENAAITALNPIGPGTPANFNGLSIGGGITNATGTSQYGTFGNPAPLTDSQGNMTLWLFPNNSGQSYNFNGFPPAGSGFQTTTLSNVVVSTDMNLALTLQMPVTLSGHVFDPLGNPVPNQVVGLSATNGASGAATTDASGYYSFQISTGTYRLEVAGNNNNFSLNVPQWYAITVNNFSITGDTVLDLTIPAERVSVHIQDMVNNPLRDIALTAVHPIGQGTPANLNGLTINENITNASGASGYGTFTNIPPKTNIDGDVILWLFPNNGSNTYSFTATPPIGSIYSIFTLNNIRVTSNQNELISLQFVHDRPLTTATLSPNQNPDGTYPDPVSITLAATAASGFTIANTFYTVDGGPQQTHISPFTVSGNGDHTIIYWSIDSVGVLEAPNSITFTIRTNQAPSIDSISDDTKNEGETYAANGSFTDATSTNWTATVDYGDGSGEQQLTLSGKNFSLSHLYEDNGNYIVTVKVTDNQGAIGTESTTVQVLNVAPSVNVPIVAPEPSSKGDVVIASVIFSDPALNDAPFTCSVDYGDGSGSSSGTVSGNGCIGPSHTYSNTGSFTLTVGVTDKDNGTGSNSMTHTVIYDFSSFLQPVDNLPIYNTVKAGQAIPVRFSLSGNQSLNIFAAGYPKSEIIQCNSNAQVDGIEETVSAGTSSLSYDPVSDTYTYIWKTDKAWANNCRQLVVKLNDGTFYRANFKFIK
jgi:protocatechuate 3,4-dioxygenase beta subunit